VPALSVTMLVLLAAVVALLALRAL